MKAAAAEDKKIYLIGVGPGAEEAGTCEAIRAIAESECVIGAERLLSSVKTHITGKPQYPLVSAEEIIALLSKNAFSITGILLSGDPGFYSGAKKLIPLIRKHGWQYRVVAAVSSLSWFAAALGISWDDVKVLSLHGRRLDGRRADILGEVMYHEKTCFLTDTGMNPAAICGILVRSGFGDLAVRVGENLSYPNERISSGRAGDLEAKSFDPLSIVLVENPAPRPYSGGNYSLRDDAFIRSIKGKSKSKDEKNGENDEGPTIPMTKEEVRTISVSKLALENAGVAWDIGAGTGSVSCEMAMRARYGRVYAIEHNPGALSLLEQNKRKLGLANLEVVSGSAPAILETLPAPDRVFIGGSSGQMEGIIKAVLRKNPQARLVINAVTLETLSQAVLLLKQLSFQDVETVQVAISRSVKAGDHTFMKAENPVYIISGWGNNEAAHGL